MTQFTLDGHLHARLPPVQGFSCSRWLREKRSSPPLHSYCSYGVNQDRRKHRIEPLARYQVVATAKSLMLPKRWRRP